MTGQKGQRSFIGDYTELWPGVAASMDGSHQISVIGREDKRFGSKEDMGQDTQVSAYVVLPVPPQRSERQG